MLGYQVVALQMLALLALVLGLLLGAFAIYVRIRQSTYTEKRFGFYAFLSCSLLATTTLFAVFNVSPWELALRNLGLPVEPSSFSDKALGVGLVVAFTFLASHWARSWSGQLTQSGGEARTRGEGSSFVADGVSELVRIARRLPPEALFVGNKRQFDELRLAPPLVDLSFHEQVLDLARAAWPDLLVEQNAWAAEARAWIGSRASAGHPLVLVCCVDKSEWNAPRVTELLRNDSKDGTASRVVVVVDCADDRQAVAQSVVTIASNYEVLSFSDLASRALPLAQYRREIARQFAEQELPNASFSAKEIFAAVSVRRVTMESSGRIVEAGDPEEFEAYIANWIAEVGDRQLALLGDYGQGKSTAVLALTYHMLLKEDFASSDDCRLPILVRLTGQSPKTSTPEELLSAWGGRYGLNGRALLALHRAGRTVLIFDAFDEMANVTDHADRIDHFSMLWRFACSRGKVLFTGRPNFFLDDEELKNGLRIGETTSSGPYCQALRIQPFSHHQMRIALRWMEKERRDQFLISVIAQPELLTLVRKPSLLFQVSRLWYLNVLRIDGDTVYSAKVILDFVSYSLDRQIAKQTNDVSDGSLVARFIPLRRSELEYFVCGCAIAALSNGRNNSLSASDFREVITKLVERAPEEWFNMSTHDDGSVSMPLSERIPDLARRIESCSQAVRTHGVLEFDPARADHFKFSHKSFAEVLAASAVVSAGIQERRPIAVLWRQLGTVQVLGQRIILAFARDISVATLPNLPREIGEFEVFRNLTVYSRVVGRIVWPNLRLLVEFFGVSGAVSSMLRRVVDVDGAEPGDREGHRLAAVLFGADGQQVDNTKRTLRTVTAGMGFVSGAIGFATALVAGATRTDVGLGTATALGAAGIVQFLVLMQLRGAGVIVVLPVIYARLIANARAFSRPTTGADSQRLKVERHSLFLDKVISAGLQPGIMAGNSADIP